MQTNLLNLYIQLANKMEFHQQQQQQKRKKKLRHLGRLSLEQKCAPGIFLGVKGGRQG
jgi:hypothetical protein